MEAKAMNTQQPSYAQAVHTALVKRGAMKPRVADHVLAQYAGTIVAGKLAGDRPEDLASDLLLLAQLPKVVPSCKRRLPLRAIVRGSALWEMCAPENRFQETT